MKSRMELAAKKWGLSHWEEIYRHPTKAVFSAQSEQFGPVILKIDQNIAQLRSEHRMLAGLSGDYNCKVYAYDESAGLLLEERIIPGTVLRREASLEKRIQVFTGIFRGIHFSPEVDRVSQEGEVCLGAERPAGEGEACLGADRPAGEGEACLEADRPAGEGEACLGADRPAQEGETYLDWLEGICEYCTRNDVAEELQNAAVRARGICAEMFEKYPDRLLLHGDLHHDNILARTDGSYAMIDPKGVMGPAILDLPRFILNELDTDHACPDREHIREVIRLLGAQTGYPEGDIGKLYFMEAVLANIWCAEDGEEMNRHELEVAGSFL